MARSELVPVAAIGSFAAALLALALLALLPVGSGVDACAGEPVVVDFPYDGGPAGPQSCLAQCADGRRRYLVYANGVGTQCEDPPGCTDWGEDHGITCGLPGGPAR